LPATGQIPVLPAGDYFKKLSCAGDGLFISVMVPVHLEGRLKPAGHIVMEQPLKNEFLDKISELTDCHVTITDDRLEFIATTIRDEDMRRFRLRIEHEPSGGVIEFTVPGERYTQLGVCLPLALRTDYFLVTSKSSKALHQNLLRNQRIFAFLAIICAIISIPLSLFTARKFTSPLDQLVTGVTSVSGGSLDYRVNIATGDEIEFLAVEFNKMADNLKKMIGDLITANSRLDRKIHELDFVNRAIHAIINQNDISQLLSSILEIVIEAIGCSHGSIMLLEESVLRAKVVRNRAGEISPAQLIVLRSGDGIAGKVLETGVPALENNLSSSTLFLPYSDQEHNLRLSCLLCLPLTAENMVFGVINLLNKESGFTPEDCKLGLTLAGEVAIAIKKRQLYELAITDGLTGVFIHRFFQARLDEEILRAKRFSNHLSLIMFDIDHFKRFNDQYGHQLGDMVLKSVADAAQKVIRQEIDFLSRYGGEEFAVVCPGTHYQGALKLAERIREAIADVEQPSIPDSIVITCSFGVACLEAGMGKKALIEKADQALYRAKEQGRNRVC
ncbi:MAG: diguanylate cyclase, partial [Candidatus Wallbacteria bacterium]|nr:diguanylate cyclase [Candidatus Wallbacteria bacterium]